MALPYATPHQVEAIEKKVDKIEEKLTLTPITNIVITDDYYDSESEKYIININDDGAYHITLSGSITHSDAEVKIIFNREAVFGWNSSYESLFPISGVHGLHIGDPTKLFWEQSTFASYNGISLYVKDRFIYVDVGWNDF